MFYFRNTFGFNLFNEELEGDNNMGPNIAAYEDIHDVIPDFQPALIEPHFNIEYPVHLVCFSNRFIDFGRIIGKVHSFYQ